MQKNFFVGTLQQCHGQNKKEVSNGQVIAFRSNNTLVVQNIDIGPGTLEFDAVNSEVVLKFKVNDGDMLVIQDRIGIADKKEIKK
jgi:putative methionine-R-sulfoxide reductase with GAF domain